MLPLLKTYTTQQNVQLLSCSTGTEATTFTHTWTYYMLGPDKTTHAVYTGHQSNNPKLTALTGVAGYPIADSCSGMSGQSVYFYASEYNSYGPGGCAVTFVPDSTSGEWRQQHKYYDNVGSLRLFYETRSNGNTDTIGYLYSSFGERIGDSLRSRVGYIGKEHDHESGYVNLGVRFYEPTRGLFAAPDPLWSAQLGNSAYHYGYNSPLMYSDPTGLLAGGGFGHTPAWDDREWYGGADVKETMRGSDGEPIIESKTDREQREKREKQQKISGGKQEAKEVASIIDKLAAAGGAGTAIQELLFDLASKRGELDKGSNMHSSITKALGRFGFGLMGAAVAGYELYHNSTSVGAWLKFTVNGAMVAFKVNPIVGITMGILDATGVSEQIYKTIGEGIEATPGALQHLGEKMQTLLVKPINSLENSLRRGTYHP